MNTVSLNSQRGQRRLQNMCNRGETKIENSLRDILLPMNAPKPFSVFGEESGDEDDNLCFRSLPKPKAAAHPPRGPYDSDDEMVETEPESKTAVGDSENSEDDDSEDDDSEDDEPVVGSTLPRPTRNPGKQHASFGLEDADATDEDAEDVLSDEDEGAEADDTEGGDDDVLSDEDKDFIAEDSADGDDVLSDEEDDSAAEEEEEPMPVKKKSVVSGVGKSLLDMVKTKTATVLSTALGATGPKKPSIRKTTTKRTSAPAELFVKIELLEKEEDAELVIESVRKWLKAAEKGTPVPDELRRRMERLYDALLVHEWESVRKDAKVTTSKFRVPFDELMLSVLFAKRVRSGLSADGAIPLNAKATNNVVEVDVCGRCVWEGVRRYKNNPTGVSTIDAFVDLFDTQAELSFECFTPWPMARSTSGKTEGVMRSCGKYAMGDHLMPHVARWAGFTATLNAFVGCTSLDPTPVCTILREALARTGSVPSR
jgi:hypothetical protein